MGDLGRFLLSALITAVLTITVLLRFPLQKKGQKLKEKAIARGFVAPAHLISSKDVSVEEMLQGDRGTSHSNIRITYKTVYEYEIDGRTYRVKAVLERFPPACTTVYYPDGNPNKVFLDGYEPNGALPAVLGLLPLIFMAVVYHLLGMVW